MEVPQPKNALLDAALAYARRGWRVFPIQLVRRADGKIDKPPAIAGGRGFYDATTDETQIRAFFQNNSPTLGIGVALAPSNLLVWDCDDTDAAEKYGDRAQVRTVSGGLHVYCHRPSEIPTTRKVRAESGLDVLTDGYTVLPPTPGYTFLHDFSFDFEPNDMEPPIIARLHGILTKPRAGEITDDPWQIPSELPEGRRHTWLMQFAGRLRNVGLDAGAIYPLLSLANKALAPVPQPDDDVRRMARDAAGMEVHAWPGTTGTLSIKCATTLGHYKPPPWLLKGFVPLGHFVQLFGPGGVGKSTIAGWLMAELTKRGHTCLYAVHEEPPELMADRVEVGGGDRSKLFHVEHPLALRFPSLVPSLFAKATEIGADLIYVDSLLSHLDPELSSYATDDMRRAFDPVTDRCIRTQRTLLACYHVTKAGTAQSSNVLRDQSRVVLRAHSFAPGTTEVAVHKTNFKRPEHGLCFAIKEVEIAGEDVPVAFDTGRSSRSAEDMLADYIERTTVGRRPDKIGASIERAERIRELLIADPTITGRTIYQQVGGNEKATWKLIREIRSSLGL